MLRRVVLLACAVLVLVAVCFPPWILTHKSTGHPMGMVYGPLWSPPEHRPWTAVVKTDLLALEVVAIVAVGAFLFLALREPRHSQTPPGRVAGETKIQ